MQIIEDVGNKESQHELKHSYFRRKGINWWRYPLPVGDYIGVNEQVIDMLARKEKRGIEPKKMDFLGTYKVCVDTKKDMQEIVGNVCGVQHARFRDECILAQNNGIKLYVLIENEDGVNSIEDVFKWHNPRLNIMIPDTSRPMGYTKNGKSRFARKQKYPNATRGEQLAKAMLTMQERYSCEFRFTTPENSGKTILELLKVEV